MNPWRDTPTLVGEHVVLRPLVADDRDALVDAASDGRLWKLFWTGVPSADTMDAYLATVFDEQRVGRAMPFAVLDAAGRMLGATRFLRMNIAHKRSKSAQPSIARPSSGPASTPNASC